MKKLFSTLFLILFLFSAFSQNKKEILQILTKQIDSLSVEYNKQNKLLFDKITNLKDSLAELSNEVAIIKKENSSLQQENKLLKIQSEKSYSAILDHSFTNFNEKKFWTELKRGDKYQSFEYTPDNQLLYFGQIVKNIVHFEESEKIKISAHEYRDDYVLCMTYDNDNDQADFYLINLHEKFAYKIEVNHYPLSWYSWSPDMKFVILGRYYEADMELFSLDLSTKNLTKLNLFTDLRENSSEYEHEIVFDFEKILWITPSSLRIMAYTNNFEDVNQEIKRVKEYTFVYYYDLIENKIILRYKM